MYMCLRIYVLLYVYIHIYIYIYTHKSGGRAHGCSRPPGGEGPASRGGAVRAIQEGARPPRRQTYIFIIWVCVCVWYVLHLINPIQMY